MRMVPDPLDGYGRADTSVQAETEESAVSLVILPDNTAAIVLHKAVNQPTWHRVFSQILEALGVFVCHSFWKG